MRRELTKVIAGQWLSVASFLIAGNAAGVTLTELRETYDEFSHSLASCRLEHTAKHEVFALDGESRGTYVVTGGAGMGVGLTRTDESMDGAANASTPDGIGVGR